VFERDWGMPRKRQISSTPEEVSEDDDLSEVPSEVEVDPEEEEEDPVEEEGGEEEEEEEGEEGEEEEGEGEEEEEEEDEEEEDVEEDSEDNVEEDEDFEQQSEDEAEAVSSEEDESDETPLPPAPPTTTTSKGRVSRKPVAIQQPIAPPVTTRPARSTTRAEPPEAPKIKLKLSLHPQQVAMEEIKVENPPKEGKSATPAVAKVEGKVLLPKVLEKAKGKQPEVVAEDEDDEEESSSSVLEEDEEDLSEMDEDDIPGGTEMEIDEEEEEEDEETERSRTGTPMDSTRLTKRQQAKFNESLRPHSLMSLPNGILPTQFKLTRF
jgi:hypothetical protein